MTKISTNQAATLLNVSNVSTYYGAVQALRNVSLIVRKGEIVTLIGANGAGKSTLMMSICGDPKPRSGSIIFAGQELVGMPTHQIIHRGIAHSPEGRRIFSKMSVRENILIGAQALSDIKAAELESWIYDVFPRLYERRSQVAGTLSGGEQQMLAIARALMAAPDLLLLDEPSLGLAPLMSKAIFGAIQRLNEEHGLTVLLVEQNAYQALRLAHRGYVLVNGAITLEGTGRELLNAPEVRAAYLEGAA